MMKFQTCKLRPVISAIYVGEPSLVPRPIPLKSHRSGVFGDVRITSGGRDLPECADLSDRAGRAPAVVKR